MSPVYRILCLHDFDLIGVDLKSLFRSVKPLLCKVGDVVDDDIVFFGGGEGWCGPWELRIEICQFYILPIDKIANGGN